MAACNSFNRVDIDNASPEQTARLGLFLGRKARAGDLFLLAGDLGAGKTTLTQAVARGLGVPAKTYVTSPSFALLHEYQGRIVLYHMDLYRLGGEDEVEAAGLVDYLDTAGLTVIEWPDRLGGLLPRARLEIEIFHLGGNRRRIRLSAHGGAWRRRWTELAAVDFS